MKRNYTYLIVGGGMAANAAIRGIREIDTDGSIGVIGEEIDPPYRRPWLSKALWKGKSLGGVAYKTEGPGVDLHLGRRVTEIDTAGNRVVDHVGDDYTYDALLLATGVRPREIAPSSDRIIAFRTLADFRHLWDLAQQGATFAVVGSGFIGSEIAAALAMNGKHVTMIFPGTDIGDRLFPADLAGFITDQYRQKGIDLLPGTRVGRVSDQGDRVSVDLTDRGGIPVRKIEADVLVSGIGSVPNDELAKAAGIAVDNGIIVDRSLRTSQPNIFAAGDVARFFQPSLNASIRVEHEDNALKMGKAAGRSMAGQAEPYEHLPFFYSDLFDMGYEAVGELSSKLVTVADWLEPFKRGVVYYLDGDQVRGVLNWNVWDKIPTARNMIGKPLPVAGQALRGEMLAS